MKIKKKQRQKISLIHIEKDVESQIEIATNGGKKERMALVRSPHVTPEALTLLVNDEDHEIYRLAIEHPNIDRMVFDKVITMDKMTSSFYMNFSKNESFKKEWTLEYIDYLAGLGNSSNIVLTFLDDKKFYNTDDEWLDLYNRIKEKITIEHLRYLPIGSYWTSFFQYPQQNYSEKIVLTVLDDFGDIISVFNNESFNFIIGTPMETTKVAFKIFELTNNPEYAPKEAKDVFLF